jgi:hypothetical protein
MALILVEVPSEEMLIVVVIGVLLVREKVSTIAWLLFCSCGIGFIITCGTMSFSHILAFFYSIKIQFYASVIFIFSVCIVHVLSVYVNVST